METGVSQTAYMDGALKTDRAAELDKFRLIALTQQSIIANRVYSQTPIGSPLWQESSPVAIQVSALMILGADNCVQAAYASVLA